MSTPDPKPRRKRRSWLIFIPLVIVLLLGAGLALPFSPIYLPKVFQLEMEMDGRLRSEWGADLTAADKDQRVKAAAVLGKMNEGGRQELPKLVKAIQTDQEADVRAAASDAATKMYPQNGTEAAKTEYTAIVLGPFTAGLTDPDVRVRHNSAIGLLKLKDKARPAVAALLAAAMDKENDTNLNIYHATVRQVLLRAVGEAAAGTDAGVPTFAAILAIKLVPPTGGTGRQPQGAKVDEEVKEASRKFLDGSIDRRIAVAGLGLAGEHGKPYAPQIRQLLDSKFNDDVIEARQALKRMGLPEKE